MLLKSIVPKLQDVKRSRYDQKDRISPESQSLALTVEEEMAPPEVVNDVAQRVLSGMPLRFIDLNTGTFCSSPDILHTFKRSPEYQTLASDKSLTPEDLAEKAEKVIHRYFAYVMLSHVWDDDEPLYGDVKSIPNVLEMSPSSPGLLKLQNFSRVAKQRGYRWCWSDTCCIDKSSSAELQESINSMFTWYRNSALTIAFLSDVLQSTLEVLKRSRWFTRGWTLQELLAPTTIAFYMGDWTPFLVPSAPDATPLNYKLIPEFIQYLQDTLGIDKSYLVGFHPGLDDVREKLRWMAIRKTTKVEDMAYCLLGILNLHLPVLYGEGERSFIRLQDEIMKNTDDTSIFDWVGRPSTLNSYLARSPACFHQPTRHPILCHQMRIVETVSEFSHDRSAALLRIAEILLDTPPLGHFIANGRMNLCAFVYQIKSVKLVATTPTATEVTRNKQRVYRYRVEADNLEPTIVVTTYKLPDADLSVTARSLSIGRVWDNSLRIVPRTTAAHVTATGTDELLFDAPLGDNPWTLQNDDYVHIVAKRLREPFVAQLLVVHPNGQFHRVHTEERIVAQLCMTALVDARPPRMLIVH